MKQGLESGGASYDLTKSDWRYGSGLGVFATPAVFVNGVQIFGYDAQGAEAGTDHAEGMLASMTLDEWMHLLQPTLNKTSDMLVR